ncbi:MAG TPA: NAD-dependent epimerase/dehydratase family protein [Gemmatimonadales bacterium]|jgi:UDP-glucuronate 4-epimerase|nr:NAD-dependent epimerase/dehydratase family protein [Gemmatimonadales bacterium]
MTRVLVTGAAGFIGSHLVEALAGRGDDVVGVDNFDPFYPRAMKERNLREIGERPGFCFHELDMLEVEALARLLRPDTVLIHLAGKAGVRPSIADPVGYARANVGGTAAVLEAARRAGVRRVVYGSSSSVYGDSTPTPFREDAVAVEPVSPYAATKRAGELLVHAQAQVQGLQVASLRFFTVFGPRQRPDLAIHSFARRMSEGRPLTLFGDGTQSRDYTYCDDIVAGVLAAVDWTATAPVGTEIFNLGGSRPVALKQLVATLSTALGIQPVIEWAPMQPGDVQQTWADVSKSARVLGYAPQTRLEEGIDRFVTWFRGAYARER